VRFNRRRLYDDVLSPTQRKWVDHGYEIEEMGIRDSHTEASTAGTRRRESRTVGGNRS